MDETPSTFNRRQLLKGFGAGAAAFGAMSIGGSLHADDIPRDASGNIIPGFEPEGAVKQPKKPSIQQSRKWQPFSDKKVRVGIAGYGLCKFGAAFFYQNHPNVEVIAASDLDKGRCQGLTKAVGAQRTYASCEEMIKDKHLDAIYIATDAPSHARLAIMALNHDKHVVCAVPAVYGWEAEEEAEALMKAVKKSGKKYMMNETSTFHADCYASRKQYEAGALGKIIYSEGEYWHDGIGTLGSYNPKNGKIDEFGWRRGLPPMWYPTHATAYYVSVTGGGRLTEVSCVGNESYYPVFKDGKNQHKNVFGTEIAMFKTSEGGMSRMGVSWDMKNAHGEKGRCYGQKSPDKNIDTGRPGLPPSVGQGGHGGSHGRLTNDFIESILLNRKPIVDVSEALNMTMSGIIAHKSALKDGEWLKVPQYKV